MVERTFPIINIDKGKNLFCWFVGGKIKMRKAYTLITGASGGIGKELAELFAKDGHNLILIARNEKKLLGVKKKLETRYGIRVVVIVLDLSKQNAAEKLHAYTTQKQYVVDHLVNNAGFGDWGEFLEADWERQNEMVQVNLFALMRLTYLYGRDMKKQRKGRILNVASVAAFCAGPYMSVYYASKAFVLSFSQAIHEEVKEYGVSVTALCPGPTKTGFETTAQLKNSKMFTLLPVESAKAVAKCGYKAMRKGQPLAYSGLVTKYGNVASRIVSKRIARKFAKQINGKPKRV